MHRIRALLARGQVNPKLRKSCTDSFDRSLEAMKARS
jgi:hypothetical protein